MKTFLLGVLVAGIGLIEPGMAKAQDLKRYAGVVGGISVLSADGRSITTPQESSVSLYSPESGPALNVFGGYALNNYVSFQGNYIWNRNRLTLTSNQIDGGGVRFYEQERTSSHHSVFGDVLVYFRERNQRIRPYLSTGVGRVHMSSSEAQNLAAVGVVNLPPTEFRKTTIVLRSAVGIDLRITDGWAVRYSFSEFIGRNPIGQQLDPPGKKSLMNFQNLVGFVRYF